MSLFDFGSYIEELRHDDKKKESIEKYESFYGPIDPDITHQVWYTEYIQHFFPYYNAIKHSEELEENDFDWKLLYALVMGSFSSEYELVRPNTVSENKEPVELLITVSNKDGSITKNLEELWSFQILRLFEIYVEEQINLQSLMAESAEDYEGVSKERLKKIRAIATYDEEFKSITRKMESDFGSYIDEQINLHNLMAESAEDYEGVSKERLETIRAIATYDEEFKSITRKMEFDFGSYIEELRHDDEKKESIEKYESFYGPIDPDITHQVWYSEYIQHFFPYYNAIKHPEELEENDFEWKLLYALVMGSFSSEYELVRPNTVSENKEPVELLITVSNKDGSITKNLEELWSFQILRLFEIYIEEQINLQNLMAESAENYEGISKERLKKIRAIATYDEEFKSITRKMKFDFGSYIEELRHDDEKKESIEKYESFYGPIDPDITHQVWYSEYIQHFFPYYNAIKHPEEMEENDFDWKLLYALVMGSFSSEYELVRPNTVSENKEPVELLITVSNKDEFITKNLEELGSFQILRLFEIYIEEQICSQYMMAESAEEYEEVTKERLEKIRAIATYDEEFKSITRKVEKESAKNILYHYTSFSTLNEILRHNSLRASDLRYLNDKNEFKIWFNAFDNVMMAMKQKEDYLSFAPFLDSIKEEIDTYRNYNSYVTCFSHERDLLSQWEMYGDKCKGIAIGFDKNELIDMMFKYNKVVINGKEPAVFPGLLQGDVEYSFETVCKDAMRMTKDIVKAYLESGENVEDFIGQESKYHFKERCMKIFMRLQDAKDPSFYAEREFRLYWNQKDQQKKVDTFSRSSRLVPFVSLTCDEKLPIKDILLGPALDDPETSIMEIKHVLKLYKYPIVNVEKSKIPYRI